MNGVLAANTSGRPRPLESALPKSDAVDAWLPRIGLGLVVLGVALRLLRWWMDFPIWQDEASLAINIATRDHRGLMRELGEYQVAPLLFLWIERCMFLWAGPSEFFLRLVPVLAGCGGLILFWFLARACLPARAAVLAVGILAVSKWPIELASNIKPYSMDLFVAVLLLWLCVSCLQRPQQLRGWIALALVAPFAVCVSYPSVFVAGAASLVLAPVVLAEKRLATRCWFVAFNALLALSFLSHFLFVGREPDPTNPPGLSELMATFWRHGFPYDGLFGPLKWLQRVHVGSLLSYPIPFNGGGLIGLALVVVGARSFWKSPSRPTLALCLLPFALHMLAAFLRRYPYGMHQRLEQHLVPSICLLAGAGLAAVIDRWARSTAQKDNWLGGCALGCAVIGVCIVTSPKRCPYPGHDELAVWYQNITQHLQSEMQSEDRLLVRGPQKAMLRWQLLKWSDRIIATEKEAIAGMQRGRVLVLNAREDCDLPSAPHPALDRFLDFDSESQGRDNWHVLSRRRFVHHMPDDKPKVFRYFCDVFACGIAPFPEARFRANFVDGD